MVAVKACRANCSFCGSGRHPTSHCPKSWQGSANRMKLRCTYCGGRDHNYEACTKHWGSGKKGSQNEVAHKLIDMFEGSNR